MNFGIGVYAEMHESDYKKSFESRYEITRRHSHAQYYWEDTREGNLVNYTLHKTTTGCITNYTANIVTMSDCRSVSQYYTDYEYPTIPAPQWTNGCPQANIVCCNGYTYWQKLKNCLSK